MKSSYRTHRNDKGNCSIYALKKPFACNTQYEFSLIDMNNEDWFNGIKEFATNNGFAASPKDYKNNPDEDS